MTALLALAIGLLLGPSDAVAAPAAEQLVVFVQRGASPLQDSFEAEHVSAIASVAESLGVPLVVRDVAEGAPAEVTITPLVMYQNHLGRSVYQGRFTTTDRVRSFVRTMRARPQGEAAIERSDALVRRDGRATIVAPVKLTELSGTRSDGFDEPAFRADALAAFDRGMASFAFGPVRIGRADRLWYVDLHPYRGGDRIYLSMAIFSGFHCHEPVFVRFDDPLTGDWSDWPTVFEQAGAVLEKEIRRQMTLDERGDGFDPVPDTAPVASWEAIGLALPPAPASAAVVAGAPLALVDRWMVDAPEPGAPPVVAFRFPAPLDAYAGEATTLSGSLVLGPDRSLRGASGQFEVDPRSVTMGEPDLDSWIHGRETLDAASHPAARFVIDRVEPVDVGPQGELASGGLEFGTVTPVLLHGSFEMKGRSVPLAVRATFEPVAGADGRARLAMVADWSIRLANPFEIAGPDGPGPANDTLLFTLHAILAPVAGADEPAS